MSLFLVIPSNMSRPDCDFSSNPLDSSCIYESDDSLQHFSPVLPSWGGLPRSLRILVLPIPLAATLRVIRPQVIPVLLSNRMSERTLNPPIPFLNLTVAGD